MAIPPARRWPALAALVLCVIIVDLDITILNVALPVLAKELDTTIGGLQWILDAYIVVLAALLLPAGLLGDRLGRRRIMLAGMAVFGIGSLLAALSPDIGFLIAARVLMGFGAAAILPLSMSLLPSIFPPEQRSRAVAIWTFGMIAGFPIGPMLGGFLLEHFWWGSVFLINVPLVALTLLVSWLLLPESRDTAGPRFAAIPTIMVTAGLAAVIFAVIEAPRLGWGGPVPWTALGAGCALLTAFTITQLRAPAPMVDLRLFGNRGFGPGAAVATYLSAASAGMMFIIPLYVQVVLGRSSFDTGLAMLPMIGGLLVASLLAERIPRRLGFRLTVVIGLAIMAAGCGLGAVTVPGDGLGFISIWTGIAGFGLGLALIPSMDGILASLPPRQAGAGSGLITALRQAGSAAGVAVLGSVLSTVYLAQVALEGLSGVDATVAADSVIGAYAVAERTGDTELATSAGEAFINGMSTVLLVCAVAAAIAAAVAAGFLPGRGAVAVSQAPESDHDLARTS